MKIAKYGLSPAMSSRPRFSVVALDLRCLLLRLGVICLVLTATTLPARADTVTVYTINFTCPPGQSCALPSGSFTYDSTTGTFSNFFVVFDGVTFDMTALLSSGANSPSTGDSMCTGEASDGTYGFLIMSGALSGCEVRYVWGGTTSPGPPYCTAVCSSAFEFNDITVLGGFGDQILGYGATVTGPAGEVSSGSWSISAETTVPEPPTFPLLGAGLLALWGAWRRKRLA